MEKLTVTKAFTTPIRRLAVGQEVAPGEIDGPVAVADWQASGFLSPPRGAAPAAGAELRAGDGNGRRRGFAAG